MADLFVTIIPIVPRPSTSGTPGPKNGQSGDKNALFDDVESRKTQTPGK